MNQQLPLTIRDLYPDTSDEQLAEAERNLRRYVQIIWRIYERLKSEGKSWPGLGTTNLTAGPGSSNIPTERSNVSTNH
jgi:hypothetical protein